MLKSNFKSNYYRESTQEKNILITLLNSGRQNILDLLFSFLVKKIVLTSVTMCLMSPNDEINSSIYI